MFYLENELIKVSIKEYGGEVVSVFNKKNSTEYFWNGDPEFWNYHSPILFPNVGKVKDGKYTLDGKVYEIPQHGLARLYDFKALNISKNEITLNLKYNDKTLLAYPCKFELNIIYTLEENELKTTYEVINCDLKEIYFGIGGHPGYSVPINKNLQFDDYYLEFSEKENFNAMMVTSDGLISKNKKELFQNENIINLNYDLFKDDALIFENLNSKKVSIKSKKDNASIEFDFSGFRYIAFWTKKNAPFLCIEPWYSHADFEDFSGDFKEKDGTISLKPNEKFTSCYITKYI